METLPTTQEVLRHDLPARYGTYGGVGAAASAPRAQAGELTLATEIWGSVLDAIKAQLPTNGDATPIHFAVPAQAVTKLSTLECSAALDCLYATLQHDRVYREALEQKLTAAQAALTKTRIELLGTQAEARRTRQLSLHDSLTALPNRNYFRQRLDQALQQAAQQQHVLAVLFLDLDGFKPINDAQGHAVGDELLKIVSARLTRAVRTEDVVSRLGGDEFVCLLAGFPSRARVKHLARKLLAAVATPCKLGELKLMVRASIGIALYPADGETVDSLLARADAAMYCAKRAQCGLRFFDQRAGL